jgi:phosphoglycolate phosphatase-like HAD superfamily hydrolase
MLRLEEDLQLAARFQNARCLFFDCDGVIFDSNGFKIDAMRHALRDYSAAEQDAMLRFWRDNGGVSRWVKFRHFFEHIVRVSDADAAVERACEVFGEYSLRAYDDHQPVAEALVAARAAGRERCFVVSGASQVELETVFRKKGIDSLYAAILGSPRTKLDLVEGVLREHNCAAADALFVGDGAGDFRVCQALGVPFVYLDLFTEWSSAEQTLAAASGVTWAQDWVSLARAFGL